MLNYPVHIQSGSHKHIAELIPLELRTYEMVIITDHTVESQYAAEILKTFNEQGYKLSIISIEPGELQKNRKSKAYIETTLLQAQKGRDTCLIALGGGVIGDLTGFVAATYMRGIPYIQVPTTLLAMVDSSVGGKTSINTPEGKNLIGAFWSPSAVIIDTDFLQTLPKEHLINGWIEVLKVFLISDRDLFLSASLHLDPSRQYIQHSIDIKATLVSQDPFDKSVRALLNFGHTVGHALEMLSGYQLLHGYAVAYGMLVAAKISEHKGLLTEVEFKTIKKTLSDLGIECAPLLAYPIQTLITCMKSDKKNINQETRMVLLNGIGSAFCVNNQYTHAVSDEEIEQAINELTQECTYAG